MSEKALSCAKSVVSCTACQQRPGCPIRQAYEDATLAYNEAKGALQHIRRLTDLERD